MSSQWDKESGPMAWTEEQTPVDVEPAQLQRYRLGYFISTIGLGPAFAGFDTYVSYHLQTIAYLIGHEPGKSSRTGCSLTATACLVKIGLTRP